MESNYQAAHLVAPMLLQHFAQHRKDAQERGEPGLAPIPEARFIEAILNTAFWASLRREEGHITRISIAFLSPADSPMPMMLGHRMALSPEILTKFSPGIERAGIYLGVWYEGEQLFIWGTTLALPDGCFVVDVSEPGLLVVKQKRANTFGKLTNVAVLNGDQIKVIEEINTDLKSCPSLLRQLMGLSGPDFVQGVVNPMVQLAVSMRAHHHGGTMLVVPSGSDAWRDSIIHPLKYPVDPPYQGLAGLMSVDTEERYDSRWQSSFRKELEGIAGLTAMDGATIISDRYELLAFGAKIAKAERNQRIEKIYFHEPIAESAAVIVDPAQSGGTRHLSAAQFVYDQREALALVASQDGHFTAFTWLAGKEIVQAYRIDSLLI